MNEVKEKIILYCSKVRAKHSTQLKYFKAFAISSPVKKCIKISNIYYVLEKEIIK